MDTTAFLQHLMLQHGLKRRDVARLLGKALNAGGGYSNSTVDRWLSGKNRMPKAMLELLELRLGSTADRSEAWQRLIQQPLPYSDQRAMERDLAIVLDQVARGHLPRVGRLKKPLPLRRAGYLLELMGHLGGPRLEGQRKALLAQARLLRDRVGEPVSIQPLRAGDPRKRETQDDLARDWGLAPGADIARFRQLARTGQV
jgi:transcriptional regulator with XRE-family HTH domain